jgi:hypothetical protein
MVEHKGVSVYNTYRDQMSEDIRSLWFTTDITEQPENEFDIRDLPNYDSKLSAKDIIRTAIDNGHITNPAYYSG